jgi:hypothetical protein
MTFEPTVHIVIPPSADRESQGTVVTCATVTLRDSCSYVFDIVNMLLLCIRKVVAEAAVYFCETVNVLGQVISQY